MSIALNIATVAFFKAAGVFRVKSPEKARERFDDAFPDFLDTPEGADAAGTQDTLFAALMERAAHDKAAKIAAECERERKREEKAAKEKAKPITGGMDSATGHVRDLPPGRYVFTSAQNNTAVDPVMWAALQTFCKRNDAQLLIGRMTYNKGAFQQPDVNDTDGVYYAEEVKPYLVNGQLNVAGAFHFLADANVIPTAKFPTSGFGPETPAGVGIIVPATRIELRTTPALKGGDIKIVTATGTVTKRNYILRKTGAQAAAAHSIGAVYVDTFAGTVRHLELVEGSDGFYDVDGFYSPRGFVELNKAGNDVEAFQPGDIHAEKAEDGNIDAICEAIERFQPRNVLVHDLLDFSSRNHHNIKDPFFLRRQYEEGNTVANDLAIMASVLDTIVDAAGMDCEVHVIESNHDLAADTWLKGADWKADPINAETYLALALAKVRGDAGFNTLAYAYAEIGEGAYANRVNFHQTDESVVIAGVEMGCHGHNGANGSKGSPKQFAALGVPMNTGHTHSPSIYGATYTAGVTASLEMGYNIGASSWAIAHIITYANGQRQVLFG